MTPEKIVLTMITTMTTMIVLCGLSGNRYTGRRNKFVRDKRYLTYSALFGTTFIVVYVSQLYMDYTQQKFNLTDAVTINRSLNIIVCIVNYISQFIINEKSAKFLNNVPLYTNITYFKTDNYIVTNAVVLATVRALIFPLLIGITLIIQHLKIHPDQNILWTMYTLFPMIVSNLLNNCYFGAMIIVRSMMFALNNRVRNIAKEVNCLQTPLQMELHKPYYRMQRFCDLADLLDELAIKYKLICTESESYLQLMAISLVCSLVSNLFSITVGFYIQYQALANTLISEEPYDTFQALTNLVYLVVAILEIVLFSHFGDGILIETRTTGLLLQNISLKHADIRFQRAVEAFSLVVTTIKHKIMPLGLIEIDASLINNVLSGVTSFLLILIQSDLTLRYSLK